MAHSPSSSVALPLAASSPSTGASPSAQRFEERAVDFRPIAETDLELLRGWRNSDRVRTRMFDDSFITEERQRAWWMARADDPGYRQYLLAYAGKPLGTVSFADVPGDDASAGCGYYVGAPDAPPGSGTLLLYYGLATAFRERAAQRVVCEIFADNEPSLRLVRRFAFEPLRREGGPRGTECLVFVLDSSGFERSAPRVRALLFGSGDAHALR